MREILFRGKRMDNGEWVEGCFVRDTEAWGKSDSHAYIVNHKHPSSCFGKDIYVEVDPATVGQYTGLKDKNGKLIFEGDLLNGFVYPFLNRGEHNYFAEVVWFENSPAFGLVTHKNPKADVTGISEGNTDYMEYFVSDDWEVIGTIHDSPELLGGTSNG